ncbi:MAG: hypothetical protein ACREOD_00015 [Candidatus Dormibacteria bacterium]
MAVVRAPTAAETDYAQLGPDPRRVLCWAELGGEPCQVLVALIQGCGTAAPMLVLPRGHVLRDGIWVQTHRPLQLPQVRVTTPNNISFVSVPGH